MRTRQPYDPYRGTKVPVSKSQEAIRRLLIENGAQGYQFTEAIAEQIVELKWARGVILNGEKVVQPLRIRVSYKNRRIESVYRAIFYHLKAKFEVIRFGIMSFEEEFLPYFEARLPDGRTGTIAELMLPDLKRGRLPAMLEPLAALPPGDDEEDP